MMKWGELLIRPEDHSEMKTQDEEGNYPIPLIVENSAGWAARVINTRFSFPSNGPKAKADPISG
jgi:hypothetical protein